MISGASEEELEIANDIADLLLEIEKQKGTIQYLSECINEKDGLIIAYRKEIDRLNNIISELEKDIQKEIDRTNDLILEDSSMVETNNIRRMLNDDRQCWLFELNKLKQLKEKE